MNGDCMNALKYKLANIKSFLGTGNILWLVVIISLVFLRIASVGFMGLMPQDAYYYLYGQHLDWSYYDHPPAIAYLLRFFTDIFGDKVFVIKMTDSVITLLFFFVFYKLSACFLSARRVLFACTLLFSTLMLSTLSLVSTPDVPLMLFWTLALLTLYHAVFLHKSAAWIWSGFMMGCAFDSKYTGVLLPAGLVLFLMLSPQHRSSLLRKWFWVCMIIFAITIFPIVWWNWQHDFASFRFQTMGRMNASNGLHLNLKGLLGLLGHQSAILMPVLFVALLWLITAGIKKYIVARNFISSKLLFLYSFFVPVFTLFLLVSFFSWVKLNWIMPAYISGIILVSIYLTKKWMNYQLLVSLAVHVALAIEVLFYPVLIKSDDTWFGWDQLSRKVKELEIQHPASFVFSADDYKTSAILNFYSDNFIYGRNVIGEHALQFDYIGTNLQKLEGRNALFLNSVPSLKAMEKGNKYPAALSEYFDLVTELSPIIITNGGRPVRKFLVFFCKNYHPSSDQPIFTSGNTMIHHKSSFSY